MSKAEMTSLKAQVASLQEQNAELKEIVVKGFDNILSSLMIKKNTPETKKSTKVVKVVAEGRSHRGDVIG